MVFHTKRLIVRNLKLKDLDPFFDLMGNPDVMNPIPLNAMTRTESDKHFEELFAMDSKTSEKKIWGIDTKAGASFIGLCALIKNNENEDEIAYRLRADYWGNGYGTEVAGGLIEYGFNKLNFELITADVNIENTNSVKILEKYFTPVQEFFNEDEGSTDRRYKLKKENWLQ